MRHHLWDIFTLCLFLFILVLVRYKKSELFIDEIKYANYTVMFCFPVSSSLSPPVSTIAGCTCSWLLHPTYSISRHPFVLSPRPPASSYPPLTSSRATLMLDVWVSPPFYISLPCWRRSRLRNNWPLEKIYVLLVYNSYMNIKSLFKKIWFLKQHF